MSAQENGLEDIERELGQLKADSASFAWILEKSRSSAIPKSMIYVEKGIELAEESGRIDWKAEILTELAILYNRQGKHLEGARTFLKVDSLAREIKDSLKMAGARVNAGLSYYYSGSIDLALESYYRAYQDYQHIDHPTGLSRLLNNLAISLKEKGELEEAKNYYTESLQIKEMLKDSAGLASTKMNLALLLAEKGEYDASLPLFQESSQLFLAIQDLFSAHECQLALGKAMIDYNQWERALPLIQESYRFFKKEEPASQQTMLATTDLAEIYMQREQWPTAGSFLSEALAIAKTSDKSIVLKDLWYKKAQIEYQTGQPNLAFEDLLKSYQYNDSLHQEQRLALMEEMQTRFNVKSKEQEITALNVQSQLDQLKLKAARNRNLWLVLFGLGVSVFSVVVFRLYQKVGRQKAIIAIALNEKESLIKEIHHRVKNNLQVISSLLSLQSFQIKDQNAQALIQDSRNRVKSMALIHQNLYQDNGLVAIQADEYISMLAESLFSSYNIDKDRIQLEQDIAPVEIDVETMIPLGLILNELLSNALKYAFPEVQSGKIKVKMQQNSGLIQLSVSDNGIGLPVNFSLDKTSMGYTLIQDFTRKLQGKLEMQSKNGTLVTLSIPVPEQS